MKFIDTSLSGVIAIEPVVHSDDRGFFMETWHSGRFADHGIDANFVQDNFSRSGRGTLRGLHYQIENPQGKLLQVVRGEIFDVAVDLRKSSPMFGDWVGVTLSESNNQQLWIPPGFAHGFLVISETAEVEYKCTDYYAPEFERTIRWNDPDLSIAWPLLDGSEPVLSEKDAAASLLKDAETYP